MSTSSQAVKPQQFQPGDPCPTWCDDHETLRESGDDPRYRAGDIIQEHHQSQPVTLGSLSVRIRGMVDPEPLSEPHPRVLIEASTPHDQIAKGVYLHVGGLTTDEVRWLAAEMVKAAERVEQGSRA